MSAITGGSYNFKGAAGGFIAGEGFVYDTDGMYRGTVYRDSTSADHTAGATTAEQVLMNAYTGSKCIPGFPSVSGTAGVTKSFLTLPRKEGSMCLIPWSLLYAVANADTQITITLVFSVSGTRTVYAGVDAVGTHLKSGCYAIQLSPGETVKMYTTVATAANFSFKKSTAGGFETSFSIIEVGPGLPASALTTVV